jgi:hypothetical protein
MTTQRGRMSRLDSCLEEDARQTEELSTGRLTPSGLVQDFVTKSTTLMRSPRL